MVTFDASNFHFEYMDVVRHWSPKSQRYAGGDALITLMAEGWNLKETVFYEEYWHAGSRPVTIYHVEMARNHETMQVPVFGNPYVRRMMHSPMFQLLPWSERSKVRVRQQS
jgi:hypothetical protein